MEIRKTDTFAKWLDSLADAKGRARILVRIDRLADGNPGDVKSVGSGIMEMRVDYGPGYRVYYIAQGSHLVILLAGGDKHSQSRDIKMAIRLAQDLWEV